MPISEKPNGANVAQSDPQLLNHYAGVQPGAHLDADSRMALITSAIRKAGRFKLDLVLRRETRY